MPNDNRPVDLLSDQKGVYGIGITYDDVREEESRCYKHLVCRPDVLAESAFPSEHREALLQTLPNHRFILTYEWKLHEVMLNEALKRNPRYQELEEEVEAGHREGEVWPKGERAKLYRKIRWGQHKRQLINLNGMLKRLISEAAEPNALKLARRFHPVVRENIYRGAAISQRALQLIDVFPVLGIAIYCPSTYWRNRTPDAVKMVERGARLNQIASFMDIPMWARKLKPAVADWFCYVPDDLHCYLPEKTWEQRLWLRAIKSRGADNPELAYWIGRNVLKIGNRIMPVLDFLSDMNDWVMEAKRREPRCITRPFSPDMSVNTVRTESELWDEAIAKCKAPKSKYKIPAPWYPAGQVNGYHIVPLDSAEKLWKEGRAMHHCAGSYDYRVAAGNCYIYSVRQGDKRMATVELVRGQGKVKPLQIRAACNAEPPKDVKIAVRKWISELKAA
jgi:PcfJ-like protein